MAIGKLGLACWSMAWLLPVSLLGAQQQTIKVVNASFEDSAPGNGWVSKSGAAEGSEGVFKPAKDHFPGGAPDGERVAFNTGTDISQILDEVLEANTIYRLEALVGRSVDHDFPGYSVQLWAGGKALAEECSRTPSPGTFELSTVLHTTGPSHAQLGRNLEIHLVSNGPQVSFDQIRLVKIPLVSQVQLVTPKSDPQVRPATARRGHGFEVVIPLPGRGPGCRRRSVVVRFPPGADPEPPREWPR